MDYETLRQVVDELSHAVVGALAERVYEGEDRCIYLDLRKSKREYILLLSPERSMPRMHLVSGRPRSSGKPSLFTQYLKSRLTGSRVIRVSILNEDRMVELCFSGMDAEYRLVFELFGSSANLFLLDTSSKILSVFYPVSLSDDSRRLLQPGILYSPPPPRKGRGGSPVSIPKSTASETSGLKVNPGVEMHYRALISERTLSIRRSRLMSFVKKSLVRTIRKIEAISADLENAERFDEYRKIGEMILARLKDIPSGADSFGFVDGDGREVTVRLDPSLSPVANAELYFKRYKKAKAGRKIIASRLDAVRKEESRLRAALSEIESAADIESLERIGLSLGFAASPPEKNAGYGTAEQRSMPSPKIKRLSYKGWEILVGRSAAGNDYLSTKLARPHDLWLHAEGMPGSHVIIRNPGRGEVPDDIILKAASIAAFYSKGKDSKKVAVTYTQAAFVKKPRGARPGAVIISRRRTVMAVPELDTELHKINNH